MIVATKIHNRPVFFYGWVVVALCFLTVAVSYGIRYSFSVFYVAILQEFGWSRASTALIFSINILVYGMMAPLVGIAVERLGPRKSISFGAALVALAILLTSLTSQLWHFYILFGVVAAMGMCATGFVPNSTLVSHWFVRRRGAAFGLFAVGFGFAYMMASGVEPFISRLGWRSTFVLLAVLAAAIVPVIAVFQRLEPREKGQLPDGDRQKPDSPSMAPRDNLVVNAEWASREWTLAKALKTRRLWCLFLCNMFTWGVAVNLVLAHQVAFAVDEGYSSAFGAMIFSLYGICYGLGNLLGFLSDRWGRELVATVGMALGVVGVSMLVLNQGVATPWLMFGYSLFFGMGLGVVSPTFTAAIADIFPGRHFGAINGIVVVGFGIGGSISPWLGGKIFDVLGTYIPAFYIVIGALVMAAASLWLAAPRRVRLVPGMGRRLKSRQALTTVAGEKS